MSAINPWPNKSALQNVCNSTAKKFCSANVVLQNALKKLGPEVKNSLLLRCDELPFVQADEESIETVFLEVIQMIINRKDAETKLYLHISSTTDIDKTSDLSLPEDSNQFLIQFHTNIIPCSEWMKITEQKINNLIALLAQFGGSLTVNPLKNSGCILTVSMPGKL